MARRKKTSPAEDVMDLVSLLPWWAGVALAVVLYVVLHRVATQQMIVSVAPGQIGDMVTQTVWRSLANVSGSQGADALDGMS